MRLNVRWGQTCYLNKQAPQSDPLVINNFVSQAPRCALGILVFPSRPCHAIADLLKLVDFFDFVSLVDVRDMQFSCCWDEILISRACHVVAVQLDSYDTIFAVC